MTTETGSSIGPYRVVRRLGAGGMGDVYLATSPSGRPVAVKTVQRQFASDAEFRRRFAGEVSAARAVSGAFTVAVVDADTDAELPWLATEYVAGPSLHQAVAQHGPLGDAALQVLGAGLVEALSSIHRAGIIHRDLKPSNILLTRHGPRIIDFGISKPATDAPPTASGKIIGTPGFMSPEHAAGKELTAASDVFSLGAVLAFAATGEPPFGHGHPAVLLYRAAEEPPRLDGAPEALLGLLVRCLDKNPERRPDAEELTDAFQRGPAVGTAWLGEAERSVRRRERELSRALSDPDGTRRRLLAFGGTVLATAAVGAATWGLWPNPTVRTDLPRRAWTAALPRAGLAPIACGPAAVVCADRLGVVCFDRSSGRRLWSRGGSAGVLLTGDRSRVYAVGSDGGLEAYDARSGIRLWRSPTSVSDAQAVAVPAPGLLLVTGEGGALHAFDAVNGVPRWSSSALGAIYRSQAMASAGLLVLQVMGSLDETLRNAWHYVALDTATGARRWKADAQDLYAPPSGSLLYTLTAGLGLQALSARDGSASWSRASGLPSPEAVMTNAAYAGSLSLQEDVLTCLPIVPAGDSYSRITTAGFDAARGTRLWTGSRRDTVMGYASTAHVLALGGANEVTGTALRTGRTLWSWRSRNGTATVQAATAGLFLVTTPDGQGVALHLLDAADGSSVWHQDFAKQQGEPRILVRDSILLVGYGDLLTAFHLPA